MKIKKIITSLLIVVILFNFIYSRMPVYADHEPDLPESSGKDVYTGQNAAISNTAMPELIESGTVSQKQGAGSKVAMVMVGVFGGVLASVVGAIGGLLSRLVNIIIIQVDVVMGVLTATTIYPASGGSETEFFFTIDRAVFNRINLFNANYFDTEKQYDVGDAKVDASDINLEIKKGIVTTYEISKVLAISLSLLVLIYIGIRMALSTVASDQARYKKMFMGWIESIVILFTTVYIMVAVAELADILTGIFYNFRTEIIESDPEFFFEGVFENKIRGMTFLALFDYAGLILTFWSIVYWCLLFLEIKFFWLYMKRLLMVGLLIVVSPLIIVTYSIDKAGDGKAQVFSSWLKEYSVNMLIQPLHALIYAIFVLTANAIAYRSPLVAIALLLSIGSVERMVKVVFDMKGLTTLRGVNKFMKKG